MAAALGTRRRRGLAALLLALAAAPAEQASHAAAEVPPHPVCDGGRGRCGSAAAPASTAGDDDRETSLLQHRRGVTRAQQAPPVPSGPHGDARAQPSLEQPPPPGLSLAASARGGEADTADDARSSGTPLATPKTPEEVVALLALPPARSTRTLYTLADEADPPQAAMRQSRPGTLLQMASKEFTVLLQPWGGSFHLPLWLPADGYAVAVSGATPALLAGDANASRWKVEFHTGGPVSRSETLLQFGVRPDENKVARNAFHQGAWGDEETSGGNPFGPPGSREQVTFLRRGNMWAVYVNGEARPEFDFKDRAELTATALSVRGLADLRVELVAPEEAKGCWCRPDEGALLHIGIFSGPKNAQRRQAVREQWLSSLRADPAFQACVSAEFLLGHEVVKYRADKKQIDHEVDIEREEQAYGDIWRVPHPETYSALPDKTLLFLQRGLATGAKYLVKVDDDQMLHVPAVLDQARGWNASESIYGGTFMWESAEYEQQRGVDGTFTKYMGGPSYLLSAPLARSITEDDAAHTVAYTMYGTDAEDLDMGKWVDYARNHSDVLVKLLPISEVLVGWENRTHEV